MTAHARPAADTTRTGKGQGALYVAAALRAAADNEPDIDRDDVALADVLVLGVRLADLQPADLNEAATEQRGRDQ